MANAYGLRLAKEISEPHWVIEWKSNGEIRRLEVMHVYPLGREYYSAVRILAALQLQQLSQPHPEAKLVWFDQAGVKRGSWPLVPNTQSLIQANEERRAEIGRITERLDTCSDDSQRRWHRRHLERVRRRYERDERKLRQQHQ